MCRSAGGWGLQVECTASVCNCRPIDVPLLLLKAGPALPCALLDHQTTHRGSGHRDGEVIGLDWRRRDGSNTCYQPKKFPTPRSSSQPVPTRARSREEQGADLAVKFRRIHYGTLRRKCGAILKNPTKPCSGGEGWHILSRKSPIDIGRGVDLGIFLQRAYRWSRQSRANCEPKTYCVPTSRSHVMPPRLCCLIVTLGRD
jgi:hypothetical protein